MNDGLINLDEIVGSVDADEVVKAVLSTGDFDPVKEARNLLPYTHRVSANDIVPEEYQQKLMAIDFTMSQCFWLIGDICVDLVEGVDRQKAKEFGKIISKQDIFEAVGLFCHRTGRATRYYYECARFFSPETRKKYDVPFSIFAEARWSKEWEVLLKIAADNPVWGADRVRAEYYKQIGEEPPHRLRDKKWEDKTGSAVEREEEEEREPTRYKDVLLSKLDHTVDDLRKILEKIPMPTDLRVRIGDVLFEIQDIELEIRREG